MTVAEYPTVELYVNSVWTDITSYVYYRDMIDITRGQSGEGAQTDTSTCRLTLNNRDGRFSPRNPEGAYYGQLGRNTPVRVSIDAAKSYLNLPGASADKATTPDHASLDITGDIDIRFELEFTEEAPPGGTEIIGKFETTGDQRSWLIYYTGNEQFAFRWNSLGTLASQLEDVSDTITMDPFTRKAIRLTLDVNDGAGNHVTTWYTSDSIDGEWTEVSSDTTAGTTVLFASTADVELGSLSDLAAEPMTGRLYKAEIRDGIGGTAVANPDFTAQAAGTTSFSDAAGRTWTIAGAASIDNRKTRFVGEISALNIDSDRSGNDATVRLEAAGIMRRLTQGRSPLDSALLRFIKDEDPIECWPLTDGVLSTVGASLVGGRNMIQDITTSDGDIAAVFAEGSLAEWIEPVIAIEPDCTGSIIGIVPNSSSAASKWSVDFFMSGGGNESAGGVIIYDRGAGTDDDPQHEIFMVFNGNLDSLATLWSERGDTTSSSGLVTSAADTFIYDENLHHVRFTADPGASDTDWEMYIDGVLHDSGTLAFVVKAVKKIELRWGFLTLSDQTMTRRSFGYFTYWDGNGPTAAEMWDAANGHRDELAEARIDRLTAEESVSYLHVGADADTFQVDVQGRLRLMELLRECEAADIGFLYEPREFLGLAYRDRLSLYNQDARLTLNYSAHELSESLIPIEDDQVVRNDITVRQTYGSEYQVTLDEGRLSTQDPPNGVGRYDDSLEVNLYNADDLSGYASWKLHLGTVDEARYPTISLNLRHSTFTGDTAMMDGALRLDLGDRIVIQNPPSWLPPDDINLMAVGFTERLGVRERDIVINCVPETPFHVAVAEGDTYERVDTDGTTIIEDLTTTETDVDVLTEIGSAQWMDSATYSSEFPFDVICGGEVMSVTACTHGLSDDFSANQTDSWGSADVGGTWTNAGGAASDYDVAGGVGTHLLTSTNTSRRSTLTSPSASFDIYCDIATDQLATGASLFGGIMSRVVDASNLYLARLEFTTSNTIILAIRERAAAVEATLGTAVTLRLTHVAGTYYRVRFQGDGTSLRAKAWLTTELEPGPWQVDTTDSTLTGAGSIGCRSIADTGNTNVNPVVSYDNFKLINPQIMTVTRSVNGVVKAQSSGTDLRLAYPAIVPL